MPIKPTIVLMLLVTASLPAIAAEPVEVVASQDLTVRRNSNAQVEQPAVEKGIHPKSIKEDEKNRLDRIAMIRFDSQSFGKDVRGAALLLQARDGDMHKERYRFRVYGVRDGDKEDETFTEKEYKPAAKGSLYDDSSNMIDRQQVATLGSFTSEPGKQVQFSSESLLAFIRADKNGTVTIVITRETENGGNSVFEDTRSQNPPKLKLIAPEAAEPAEEAKPAEDAPEQDGPPAPGSDVEGGASQ